MWHFQQYVIDKNDQSITPPLNKTKEDGLSSFRKLNLSIFVSTLFINCASAATLDSSLSFLSTLKGNEPTRIISSTEDWNKIWNSVLGQEELIIIDNSLTVEPISKGTMPPTASRFILQGKEQAEGRATISSSVPAGNDSKSYHSLINLGVKNTTSISIENIDFKIELEDKSSKSGLAININNRSTYRFPELDSIKFNQLSFSGFNDQYVIAIDVDKQSPARFDSVKNFTVENINFNQNYLQGSSSSLLRSSSGTIDNFLMFGADISNNSTEGSLIYITAIKEAAVKNICIKNNSSNTSGIFLDGSPDDSSIILENLEFYNNTVTDGSSLQLQQFYSLTLKDSQFIGNFSGKISPGTNTGNTNGGALLLAPDGGAAVGSDPKDGMPWVENVLFKGNTATGNGGAVYSAGNVHFSNTSFVENEATAGGAVYFADQATTDLRAIFTNVTMSGNNASSGKGNAIYGELYRNYDEIDEKGMAIDIEAIDRNIEWNGANDTNQSTIAFLFFGAHTGNYFNLGLYSQDSNIGSDEPSAELKLSGGISVESQTSENSYTDNVSNISIGGSTDGKISETSNVKLGGKSTFNKASVNFDVKAGRFELLPDADVRWRDGAAGRFTVAAGSEFRLALQEVDPADVMNHGLRAKIHLAGNSLDLAQGSLLSVQWNEKLESLPAVGSHWLILAEDAQLTENSAPDVSVITDNWILDYAIKVSDGVQLSQGIVTDDGTVVDGTSGNVYVGFDTESTEDPDPIDPDEDIRSATNLTAHFAYSSIRQVSRGMLHWRPVRSDAFWAIPQYLHDRRDRDDFGVGFDAQLRGITVGKDFTTENGFWGAAFGYGDGNIHSLGGIAYTSGNVQSWWAGIYGQRNINDWHFKGVFSYLCQDADQDQSNSAANLHLNTKNDAVLVSGKAARSFVLDANTERTIRMTPSVGLEYIWLKQRDFNVRMDSGETLLKGKAEDMNALSVPVDLRFDREWASDNGWRHNASFTVGGDFNFGDDTMSGDFTGPNDVATNGWRLIPLDDYQGRVVTEYVLLHPKKDFSISAGAGYTFSKSRELLDLQAVIRYTW